MDAGDKNRIDTTKTSGGATNKGLSGCKAGIGALQFTFHKSKGHTIYKICSKRTIRSIKLWNIHLTEEGMCPLIIFLFKKNTPYC